MVSVLFRLIHTRESTFVKEKESHQKSNTYIRLLKGFSYIFYAELKADMTSRYMRSIPTHLMCRFSLPRKKGVTDDNMIHSYPNKSTEKTIKLPSKDAYIPNFYFYVCDGNQA